MAETTRFTFQQLGGAQTLEPADYNAFQSKADSNLNEDPSTGTAGTGVAITYDRPRGVRKMRLTLTDAEISITAALDYGSLALLTLPDSNLIVIGAEVDLSIVKGDAVNGLNAADDLDIALGTAAATATDLTATAAENNILAKQDVDADAVTVTLQAHSLAASPALVGVVDGAANSIYLNASGPNITADDTLTVSGTVDLYFIDVGNETS